MFGMQLKQTDDQEYWLNGKVEPVEHRTREGETMRTKVADNGLISYEYTNHSGETREESTPRQELRKIF